VWFRKRPDPVVRYQNELVTGDPGKPWFRLIEDSGGFRRACSLGSGASLAERELMRLGVVDSWDLYDISPWVLRRATLSMGRYWRRVSTHVADVNFVTLPRDAYDLVLCNASLHHFVELERVLDQIAGALNESGLFLVWEYVGENRLQWSEARIAFQQALLDEVPEEFRVSPDARLEPADTAPMSPFEAVRSADIPALLQERFHPEFWKTFGGALAPLVWSLRVDDMAHARPDVLDRLFQIDRELSEKPSDDFVNPVLCALLRRR
jgi:SAM-dependent methyltransferase